jgi:hypothetical protein
MKKLILGLFSLITVSCFAQNSDQVKLTQEAAGSIIKNTMASFTQSVSFAYKKGISYKQFRSNLLNGGQAIAEADGVLQSAYNYLSSGSTKEDILRNDDGKAITDLFRVAANTASKNPEGLITNDGSALFGGKVASSDAAARAAGGGCRWYQFWCHVQAFANWVVDHATEILQIVCAFIPQC